MRWRGEKGFEIFECDGEEKELMRNTNLAFDHITNMEENCSEHKINRLPQKLFGMWCILVGVILPMLCDGDATGSLLLMPLGVVLLIEKSKVM